MIQLENIIMKKALNYYLGEEGSQILGFRISGPIRTIYNDIYKPTKHLQKEKITLYPDEETKMRAIQRQKEIISLPSQIEDLKRRINQIKKN